MGLSAVVGWLSRPVESARAPLLESFVLDRLLAVAVRTEPAFKAESPEELFTGSYSVRTGRNYDIDPNGQRFLMIKPAETAEVALGSQVILVENWFEELKRLVPTD